jgi:hypothetical protein
MRIISKKNDYYDSAQAFGQDQSVIYKRNGTWSEVERDSILPGFKFYSQRLAEVEITTDLIGFCGKIYPVFSFELPTGRIRTTRFYVYTIQEVEKLLAKYKQKKALVAWNKMSLWRKTTPRMDMYNYILEWKSSDRFLGSFISRSVPIWLFKGFTERNKEGKYRYKFYTNISNLKQYDFFKIYNSFEAYQEIAMFLESTLAKEKVPDPTNVPDCYLAAAKGFDSWSFRKQPTKKGRKAKKRSVKCK